MVPGPILYRKWGLAPFIRHHLFWHHLFGTVYSQGFALLSSGEKPYPLSPSHGFFTIQPSPCKGTRLCRAASMSERRELRRRREERMENGVKNLKGARLFPKTLPNHRFRDASRCYSFLSLWRLVNALNLTIDSLLIIL